MTNENDKRRVLHLHHVEMLYAAAVEAFVEWQTAIVEAVVRAALSDATPPCLRAHERCTAKLASPPAARDLLSGRPGVALRVPPLQLHVRPSQLPDAPLDTGRRGLRDRGGRWRGISVWTDRNERGYAHTYAPCVTVAFAGKALNKRRRFNTAAIALGDGGPMVNLVLMVDRYIACLSANCGSRRPQNPVPVPDRRRHDHPRTPPPRARPGVAPDIGRARTGRHRTGGRSLGVTPSVAHTSRGTGRGRRVRSAPRRRPARPRAPRRSACGVTTPAPRVRSADRIGDRKGRESSFMDMDMQFYWGLGLILGSVLLYVVVTGDARELAKQIDGLREDLRSGSLGGTTARSRRRCRNRTRRACGARRQVR